jgi:hypothetical protein
MKTYSHVAILMILSVFAEASVAEEHWLEYRSAQLAQKEVSIIRTLMYDVSLEEPEGADLPEFVSKKPLYFKWQTPMADKGYIMMAFDRTRPGMQYDTLYIDSNGDGKLDEEPVKAYEAAMPYGRFSPVRLVFNGDAGTTVYHLYICVCGREKPHLHVGPACWYEGAASFDDKKTRCVLIDYNVNGIFNDKSRDPEQSDRIIIGAGKDEKVMSVGNLVPVGNRFYEPRISRDGGLVDFAPAENVRFGRVVVPEGISKLSVAAVNGLFDIALADRTGSLPVGQYAVQKYTVECTTDGTIWKAEAAFGKNPYAVDIRENADTVLDIGEPFITKLDARQQGSSSYNFNQQLVGRKGETLKIRQNDREPPAPKLWITNDSGSYDRKYSFSYG